MQFQLILLFHTNQLQFQLQDAHHHQHKDFKIKKWLQHLPCLPPEEEMFCSLSISLTSCGNEIRHQNFSCTRVFSSCNPKHGVQMWSFLHGGSPRLNMNGRLLTIFCKHISKPTVRWRKHAVDRWSSCGVLGVICHFKKSRNVCKTLSA